MRRFARSSCVALGVVLLLISRAGSAAGKAERPGWLKASAEGLERELVSRDGEAQRPRAHRGLEQVAQFWRDEDGDAKAFEGFVRDNFAGDEKSLDTLFQRMEDNLEALDGHMNEIVLAFKAQSDLDRGPVQS